MDTDYLLEAKVYVGTYKKYNEGSLFGKWLNLADYSDHDEFYEACKELHADEDDAEFMFQDWEYIPRGQIGESWISESIFELIGRVDEIKELGAFMAFLDFTSYSLEDEDLDYLLSKFNDCYHGKHDSEEDFAEYLVDNGSFGEIPDHLTRYIDYEKIANDLFITDYYFDDDTKAVFNRNY